MSTLEDTALIVNLANMFHTAMMKKNDLNPLIRLCSFSRVHHGKTELFHDLGSFRGAPLVGPAAVGRIDDMSRRCSRHQVVVHRIGLTKARCLPDSDEAS